MSSICVVALCALVVMASAAGEPRYYDINEAPQLFQNFMKDYNRVYLNAEDQQKHYEAFVKNLKKINELNKQSSTATFGINKFADYTEEENKKMRGFRKPENKN